MTKADTAEPSMEEILASIRRIISEEGDGAPHPSPTAASAPARQAAALDFADEPELDDPFGDTSGDVLELTEQAPGVGSPLQARPRPADFEEPPLVSDTVASVTSQSLNALSGLLVRNYPAAENTLEGLIREMLRPMLKEWLDHNLPDLVEQIVTREITRITSGK